MGPGPHHYYYYYKACLRTYLARLKSRLNVNGNWLLVVKSITKVKAGFSFTPLDLTGLCIMQPLKINGKPTSEY